MAAGGINGEYGEGLNYGKGAAIGNGGDGGENPINGEEVDPDISGLYTTGCIKYYAAGISAADMNDPNVSPADTKSGTVIPPYTITFDANGGSCDPESLTTKDGKLEELPTPEWEGHTFTGWFTEKDGGTVVTTSTVFSSDATVYAHWEEIPAPATYTITFDPNGGTVSSGSAATGTDGKLTSLPTPEWEGHTFTGWFTEKDGGTEVTTSTVFSSDATVYAHWEEIPAPATYTITFDPNGGTVSSGSAATGTDGKLTSLPTPEWEGHTFTGWFTEKDGGTEVTTSTVFTSDATVYAHWEEIPAPATYTITFDPNGGTVSSGSAATGTDGKLTSLPTPEWEGHTFTGWFTEKDGGTEVTTSTVFTSDATVYAHWEENPEPDTPKEAVITVSVNKPMAVSTESKGEFNITYAHEIPFFGKGKITPEYFGGITVSQGNATYTATKIKVNKKKLRIQITGLSGADKDAVKKIKKATKGSNGLPFKCNPYYVRDTDKATPKFNKKGELKSVKILINNKDYKAKKDEFSYDIGTKQILFKGSNLSGSYQTK